MPASAPPSLDLLAPLSGVLMPLADVPDPVFARKLAGDGVAIDPTSADLLAPAAGTVSQVHRAGHALAVATDAGVEVLLHVGLDSVELKGEGFRPRVAVGDRVEAGQVLMTFDPVGVGRRARSLITVVLVADPDRVARLQAADGVVEAGRNPILALTLKAPAAEGPAPSAASVLSQPVALATRTGLHARPAALLAAEAKRHGAAVHLLKDGAEADAKSVVALLGLGAGPGDRLRVRAAGAGADAAVRALTALLAQDLDAGTAAPEAPAPTAPAPAAPGELAGLPAAPGFAVGPVHRHRPRLPEVPRDAADPGAERVRLEQALREAWLQLEAIKARRPGPGRDDARTGILGAHQALLDDPGFAGPAFVALAEGRSAGWAWREAFQARARDLEALASPLLRERAGDIRDVGARVLALLAGTAPGRPGAPPGSVLVAEELTPSETAQLDPGQVCGLATTRGGPTGHVAILARALGIPAVVGLDPAALDLADGGLVVLDGDRGVLRTRPGPADLAEARERIARQEARAVHERAAAQRPAVTADGVRLEVAANIRGAAEARAALAAGAEGVGLLRSEFLFQDRPEPPSEAEQAEAYAEVAALLGPGRRLVLRTLDAGGDKPLACLPLPREDNPFLGLRGIRVSLGRPELFRTQLRAALRAAGLADLHVLFPMVATLEEWREAKAMLDEEALALGARVRAGIMVEVPSAALGADALAAEVDFFSIGSNDLTQYCLAMDRGHPALARQADALHPAVLRLIDLATAAAHRHGKWVGVCGGLASEPLALPALVGLGVDELSVSVPAIGAVKATLARLDRGACRTLAQDLLRLGSAAEVRARLARLGGAL